MLRPLVLFLALLPAVQAAPQHTDPLVAQCFGCHGFAGASQGPAAPSIAGLSRIYFVNAMLAYKYQGNEDAAYEVAGETGMDPKNLVFLRRENTIMTRLMRGYSEAEIGRMADYFAQLSHRPRPQPAPAALIAKGRELHEDRCKKCHKDEGRTTENEAGILAGQWRPYLMDSLEDYAAGTRKMFRKMRRKMKGLEQVDFEALSAFYASRR